MVTIEQLAEAALSRENLLLRSLWQEFVRQQPRLADLPRPSTSDARLLAAAASLAELLAVRLNQDPPPWCQGIGSLSEPMFLVRSAATMPRLRDHCLRDSPEPLRKRGFFAPPNFLEFA